MHCPHAGSDSWIAVVVRSKAAVTALWACERTSGDSLKTAISRCRGRQGQQQSSTGVAMPKTKHAEVLALKYLNESLMHFGPGRICYYLDSHKLA